MRVFVGGWDHHWRCGVTFKTESSNKASPVRSSMVLVCSLPWIRQSDVQRATVASVVAPRNLALLEGLIRERAGAILDSLL